MFSLCHDYPLYGIALLDTYPFDLGELYLRDSYPSETCNLYPGQPSSMDKALDSIFGSVRTLVQVHRHLEALRDAYDDSTTSYVGYKIA